MISRPDSRRPQRGENVLVGQAVEPVAPHALVPQVPGQREPLGQLRHRPMERGVEADDLRQISEAGGHRLDDRDLARQMERSQRDQLAQAIEQPRGKALGSRVRQPAVDEPVADRRRARQPEPLENVEHRADRSVVIREGAGVLDRLSPSGAPRPQARAGQTQALHGTLGEELLTAGLRAKPVERELQRGGSAVQAENGGVQGRSCRTRRQPWLPTPMDRIPPSCPGTLRVVSSATSELRWLRCGKVGGQEVVRHNDRRAAS